MSAAQVGALANLAMFHFAEREIARDGSYLGRPVYKFYCALVLTLVARSVASACVKKVLDDLLPHRLIPELMARGARL